MAPAVRLNPNGVDVEGLVATVEAVQSDPSIARFQFRAHTDWISGGHSRTRVQGFHGAGGEDSSRATPFILDGDEPGVLLGSDKGPNAVEVVLHALSSCLAVGLAYNAAARGITVRAIAFDVLGELDLQGFLGLSETVRPGYQGIELRCRIESDAAAADLAELWAYVQRTSPLLDVLRNPVPVQLELSA
jgi:uncharacterized OsmC-like protein